MTYDPHLHISKFYLKVIIQHIPTTEIIKMEDKFMLNIDPEADQQSSDKVYIVCLNPHCLKSAERCLTTRTLHRHPPECSQFYYPADQIINTHWTQLPKYPPDSLGAAARKKFEQGKQGNYLHSALKVLKGKLEKALVELEDKLIQLYPQKDLARCFSNVYNLEKLAQGLKLQRNPTYLSNLLTSNFSAQNYHVLLRLNQNYDQIRNVIESLSGKLMTSFEGLLQKHRSAQVIPSGKRTLHKKFNYGIYKSKFVSSLKIQIQKSEVHFPKVQNVASFLPWIYTDKYFTDGVHQFKINSIRYPLVQNAGFTVLQEHDIDTYPYTTFKSLFSREGKGFVLVKGEQIDQFVAQTTIVTLRIELGGQPKAIIYDSENMCQYQCQLKEKKAYRMGVYGCGWAMDIIELS